MRGTTASLALVTAVLSMGLLAPGAEADPAVQVSPTKVEAGGTVTIRVTCGSGMRRPWT
ncbi:hypothetical protein [Streptomyces sp. SID10815]|uniref:hypothetical protein n=1 Tax=Streptomyces sp. SID10815 TaxID=2706027 RepID=UPI0013CACE53|nr:hypothetical protein [Streptomyces sp. SID10815]NEA46912.1 hypothetical protein [Streptomyces sp. SID10815]